MTTLFLFLGACAAPSEQDASTFVIGLESAPSSFDPRVAADAYASKINRLIYAGLFRLDRDLSLQPDLLQSYEYLSEQEFRFILRENILFHDGTTVTAKDVAWTLQSILDRQVTSPHYATLAKIESIDVSDDRTLTVKLREPYAPFLSVLTLGILPEERGHEGIGAGPFVLHEVVPEEKIILKRSPHYYGTPPQAETLIFRVIRDDNLRTLELVRGRLDLLQNNVPAALMSYVMKRDDLVVEKLPGINYAYLGFNLEDEHLKERKVREAIAHAIDIKKLIAYKLKGLARPATGVLSPTHWAYYKPKVRYTYDPEAAMRLLDAAGFVDPDGPGPRSRFRLIYKTSSKRDRVGMARLIARYLEAVGIEVIVTPYEWGTLFRDIRNGNFQMYSLTWVGVTEPDIYYYIFHSSQIPPNGANRNRYRDGAMDQLTEGGRMTFDLNERIMIYREVQKIAARDLPYISLWYEDNVVVRRRDVRGYVLTPNASFEGLRYLTREAP